MTGFELLEYLTKQDSEVLRCQIYAGEDDWDEIVDAYIDDGAVILQTFKDRWEESETTFPQAMEDYFKVRDKEYQYKASVREKNIEEAYRNGRELLKAMKGAENV